MGDFNARSGTLLDFIQIDENIAHDNFDFDTNFVLNRNNLAELDIPVDRHSCDNSCNNYGYRLVELYKLLTRTVWRIFLKRDS